TRPPGRRGRGPPPATPARRRTRGPRRSRSRGSPRRGPSPPRRRSSPAAQRLGGPDVDRRARRGQPRLLLAPVEDLRQRRAHVQHGDLLPLGPPPPPPLPG